MQGIQRYQRKSALVPEDDVCNAGGNIIKEITGVRTRSVTRTSGHAWFTYYMLASI